MGQKEEDIKIENTESDCEGASGAMGGMPENKPESKKAAFIRVIKYVFFAAGAGIIQLLVFTLLNEIARLDYWVSYIIALTCSVLFNFTLNRKFTFRSASNVPLAMFLAFLFYLPFAPYTTWLEHHLADTKGWNEYLVLLINMAQNLILEFLWYEFVVFGKKNRKPIPEKERKN